MARLLVVILAAFLPFAISMAILPSVLLPDSPSGQCQFNDSAASDSSKAVSNLAVKIYQQIAKPDENIIFSPVSIALGLALVGSGASGTTKSEIQTLLSPPGTNQEDSSVSYQSLQHQLQIQDDEGKARLSIANGIFYSQNLHLKSDFLDEAQKCFETQVSQAPFASDPESARVQINRWVSNATADKIPELFKPGFLDPTVLAVLANAVYLKAPWVNRFLNNEDLPFYRSGKSDKAQTVHFMIQRGHYNYASTDNFEAVELPYRGVPLSMYVLLPKQRDGIQAVEQSLQGDQLISLFANTQYREVKLKLPRFTIRQSMDLKAVLTNLGAPQMFTNQANFSRMAHEPLKVSKALHEAYIKVNEEGTEAAAVTAFVMLAGAGRPGPEQPISFIADHPFIYAIVHRPTSTIVFLGRVNNVQE